MTTDSHPAPSTPSTPSAPAATLDLPQPQVSERAAADRSGWIFLLTGILLVFAAGFSFRESGQVTHHGGRLVVLGLVIVFFVWVTFGGLTAVAPGQARVLQLLGRYRGTIRTDGLRWVNPLTTRAKVSTRIRNHETGTAKVNDADGNPIEIAAVVVWQVQDTAKARFEVDDFVAFVAIQTETAVRHIANSYPYDAPGQLSLRDNAEEVTGRLSAEIAARVAAAGVKIIESRLTRLSYAPEIAQAMLRRQQAGAIVAARQQIVNGAVGMVEAALNQLAEHEVVELDEERKATMVSNLLVVLCGDRDAQPVVNTGSLYQ